jgi:aryl-alcohol dehydrogenase-like predicted oxidoreductase
MEQTRLGRSDLVVAPIAFGTWQLGGDWGPTDEAAAIAAIRRAADLGVTLFDTAQAYGFGASERLLAKALDGRRDGLVIATKGGLAPIEGGGVARDASARWIRRGVEASLRALGTDAIDLYQVHWPDPATPFAETAGTLAELVAEGKVRHVGVSNFDAAQMETFSATLPVETLQPPYHLFHRDIEASVLPFAQAHDIGVLAYGPLGHGLLSGHLRMETRFDPGDWRATSGDFRGDAYRRNLAAVAELDQLARGDLGITLSQLAVAWTLSNPGVQVAIVGTRNPAHVDEAVGAADVVLEPDVLRRIDKIMVGTAPVAGPSPELMPEA